LNASSQSINAMNAGDTDEIENRMAMVLMTEHLF
jgi:hypothetical protein